MRSVVLVFLVLTLVPSLSLAEPFTNKSGELTIEELGNWKVVQDTFKGTKAFVKLKNKKGGAATATFSFSNSKKVDVFGDKFVRAFKRVSKKRNTYFVAQKSADLAGSSYLSLLTVKAPKKQRNSRFPLVFMQQLVAFDNGRLHNFSFGSAFDDIENNAQFKHLLSQLSISPLAQ